MPLPLDASSSGALVAIGGTTLSRADVQQLSAAIEARVRETRSRRLLVASDQPQRILAAIDAASRTEADLWITHAKLPTTLIEDAAREFEIQLILSDGGERRLDSEPATSSSRICLMTSGTTGRPKIVAHTLERLAGSLRAQSSFAALAGARWLLTYQPSTFAGLQVMLTAVYSGGTLILPNARNPAAFLEVAIAHEATHVSGTPTFWRSLLMLARPGSLPWLRQATLGGEAIDQPTLDRLRSTFPQTRVTHIYASTEAGVVFSVNDGRAGFPAEWLERPVQDALLRIREGLLEVRAPRHMSGYLGGATNTPFTEDGWLRTGDRVRIDGDRVHFLGRFDALINVGGAKVDPLLVESFLLALDGVVEARVFGVANPITGFLVGAEVVLSTAEEREVARARILAECQKALPTAQVPRVLRVVDSIQTLESGKKAL